MTEQIPITGTILNVEIRTGDDIPSDEYCGYEIVITTDKGSWTIGGCHDIGPSLYIPGQDDEPIPEPESQ